jgi:hypothetical protein
LAADAKGAKSSYEIAFPENGISAMRPDGSPPRVIHRGAVIYLQPNWWSPDGRKIVYYDRAGAHICNVDGTGDEDLPVTLTATDIQMVWSPDSTHLAYASGFESPAMKETHTAREARALYTTAIYVVNIQTKQVRRLSGFGENRSISWSPDGRKVVYGGTEPKRSSG